MCWCWMEAAKTGTLSDWMSPKFDNFYEHKSLKLCFSFLSIPALEDGAAVPVVLNHLQIK